MYLALREIGYARTRFLLMGGVLALMAVLIVIISGLSAGLVNDGVSSLKAIKAESVAFEQGTKKDSAFTRSVVDLRKTDEWNKVDGITATPMGLSIVNAKNSDGTAVDLTLFGVDPKGFIAPKAGEIEGSPVPDLAPQAERDAAVKAGEPTPTPHEVVVSDKLKDDGVKRGDVLTLDRLGTKLKVVGFTDGQRRFGHVDVAYVPMDVWQEVHAGARSTEAARPEAYQEASVYVLRGTGNTDAAAKATNTEVRTMTEAFNSSPGYEAESATMALIRWFLYAIAALVTGAFFLVWTIQRSGDIAVMRAMGAGRGYLLRDSIGQAFLILVGSIVVGTGVALLLATFLEGSAMPFSVEAGPIATGQILLFVFGMIGAMFAVFRVTRVDPLAALGENR